MDNPGKSASFFVGFVFGCILAAFLFWQDRFSLRPVPILQPISTPALAPPFSPFPKPIRKLELNICCWVPVADSAQKEILAIYKTWANECDEFLFISQFAHPGYNIRAHSYEMLDKMDLWNIVHRGWALMYTSYLGKCDYFVKLDTDSYFSGANFKLLLRDRNPDNELYAGFVSEEKLRFCMLFSHSLLFFKL